MFVDVNALRRSAIATLTRYWEQVSWTNGLGARQAVVRFSENSALEKMKATQFVNSRKGFVRKTFILFLLR